MATKKNQYFKKKKDIEKGLQEALFGSVVTAVSAVGSSIGLQLAKDKIGNEKVKTIITKTGGAIVAGLGVAGNATANHYLIKAASSGFVAVGTIQTVLDNNIEFGQKMSVAQTMNGIGYAEEIDDENFDFASATEAEAYFNSLIDEAATELDTELETESISGFEDEVNLFR